MRAVNNTSKANRGDFGGGGTRPPHGFDILMTQRIPVFTILTYPYLADRPKKNFKVAFSADIY